MHDDARNSGRPGVVLVHGAFHSSGCWSPTVAELARIAPDVEVLRVDLPGRGTFPGDLGSLTLGDWVASVVARIESAGFDEVVVVGNSLGGLTAVGGGATRVARLVLLSAVVPPDGASNLGSLPQPARWLASLTLRRGRPVRPPPAVMASWFFCNGMSHEQRDLVLVRLCSARSTTWYCSTPATTPW